MNETYEQNQLFDPDDYSITWSSPNPPSRPYTSPYSYGKGNSYAEKSIDKDAANIPATLRALQESVKALQETVQALHEMMTDQAESIRDVIDALNDDE